MKPEIFADKLHKIYGADLISVVLYGSAAGADFHKCFSNFNTLILLREISLPTLAKSAKLCRRWRGRKNPSPLFVDPAHLENSRDVFPIEFHDMKERHRVLFGKDPFDGMEIHPDHLRLQCESELKGKLIALRSEWLRLTPSKRRIRRLMLESSSSFFALFRGILRLLGEPVPPSKGELLQRLCARTGLKTSPFERILEVLEGRGKISRAEVVPMMEEYLTTLERVTSFVNQMPTVP